MAWRLRLDVAAHVAVGGWLLVVGLLFVPLFAQAAQPQDALADHLAAGEFGPAIAAANGAADPAERDRLLGQVALAQAGGGARSASASTLGGIGSDVARREAVNNLLDQSRFPARGGGVQANFDPLIELITTTVAPTTWDEVGGPGSIEGFASGVLVDSSGTLRRIGAEVDRSLDGVRSSAAKIGPSGDARTMAGLRKVSLNRLEREVQLRHAFGMAPDETMGSLAGLQRIRYVLIYPETGDVVIAGPAGDWRKDREGRLVSVDNGKPTLSLDDLVVLLRNAQSTDGKFGCSITPRKEGLAAAQEVNNRWAKHSMKPSQRAQWLEEFRSAVGLQDITVYGVDPETRVARLIVEADYHMKLVGMGLEEGTLGVESYLKSIELKPGEAPPPMNVLRWWFTLNYSSLRTTEKRDAFELHGTGVKVLSENELLTEQGDRQHTGQSNDLNARFARSFTQHFEQLAAEYPVYHDLRNVFDMAIVAALVQSHDLPGQTGWHLTHFGKDGDYQPRLGPAPRQVDSIINHRVINNKYVVAGVSGGVSVDARELTKKSAVKLDTYGHLQPDHDAAAPKDLPRGAWWWD